MLICLGLQSSRLLFLIFLTMEFLKKYFFNFLDLSALQTDDENQNNKTQNTLEGEKSKVPRRKIPKIQYHRVEKQSIHHSKTETNNILSDPAPTEFSCDTFVVNIKRRNTIPVSRGACQRHHGSQLTRQMDALRRQSWRGDLHILREEEETEEDKLAEVPRSVDNEENFQVPGSTKPQCDLEKEHFSPLEMYFLNL